MPFQKITGFIGRSDDAKDKIMDDGETFIVDGYGVDGYGVSSTLNSRTAFASNPVRSLDLNDYGVWSVTMKETVRVVIDVNIVAIVPFSHGTPGDGQSGGGPVFTFCGVQQTPTTTDANGRLVLNWIFVNSSGVAVDLPTGAGAVTQFRIHVRWTN